MDNSLEVKVTHKICACCRGDLPLSDFYPSKGVYGVTSCCKLCSRFKNHNRLRSKKSLEPMTIEEYRFYVVSGNKKSGVKKLNENDLLANRIEFLFEQRRIQALLAHKKLESKTFLLQKRERERLKEVIKNLKKEDNL